MGWLWGYLPGIVRPVIRRRSEMMMPSPSLAFVSEALKSYCVKNVGFSKPISWPPESDPCCLQGEGLAILRTQVQCSLSSLFALWKWTNLTSVGKCSLWQSAVCWQFHLTTVLQHCRAKSPHKRVTFPAVHKCGGRISCSVGRIRKTCTNLS